jgi:iron complex outermembrane recepter protein
MTINRSASQEAIVSTASSPFYLHGSQIIPATRGVQLGWVRHRRVRRLFAAVVLIAMTVLLSPCANAQSDAENASPAPGAAVTLPAVSVIGTSPLIGSGIDRDTVPAETHVLTSKDLSRDGVPNAVGALNQQLGGVTLDSASGNPFQPTFFYHGFQASPLQGTPQGLAVYVNGMRFNQPFGDTVDWDLIPDIAIDRINVVGANPVFGLNALGGALNVLLKNGFSYQGFEADVSGGSFGQLQGEFQYGRRDDGRSFYVAGNALHQNGWRDLQSSEIQNVYADAGWGGQGGEIHANITFAHSILNGPGTSPVELLAVDRRAQFTAPNQIANQYVSTSINGNIDLSDATSLQGLAYYRYLHQNVVNGNAPNDTPCGDDSGLLCSDSGVSTTTGGVPIPDFLNGGPYSELDTQSTNTNAYGISGQLTNVSDLFGLPNHFVAGATFDGARSSFGATSFIGGITSPDRVFIGPGIVIDEPGSNSPVAVNITNATYGIFFADTMNLAQDVALTVSGRYNAARVDLSDQNGGDLSGNHQYNHFNPAVGMTYRATPSLAAYAGYAVTNRAPTPAELSCASPENSCSLANFFVGDPDLQQVIAHTVEAGIRGAFVPAAGASLTYSLAFFHTDLDNDIAFVNSVTQGRAFFANIGQTRRQGVDASLQLTSERWLAYAAYSYINASYQSSFVEGSGSNPAADADGNITVQKGNRLPGIPANQLKLGAYYKVTPAWTVGAVGIAASGAYLVGDEANLTPKLPGYFTLNLSTTYQMTKNVQLFAWANNVTDARYYTFGTFAPTSSVFLAQAPNATDPRSYSPAAPASVFGGVRVTF